MSSRGRYFLSKMTIIPIDFPQVTTSHSGKWHPRCPHSSSTPLLTNLPLLTQIRKLRPSQICKQNQEANLIRKINLGFNVNIKSYRIKQY